MEAGDRPARDGDEQEGEHRRRTGWLEVECWSDDRRVKHHDAESEQRESRHELMCIQVISRL